MEEGEQGFLNAFHVAHRREYSFLSLLRNSECHTDANHVLTFMVCAPALFLGLWRTSFRPQVLLPLFGERQAYFRWPGTKTCRSAIATKWGRSQTAVTAGDKWENFMSSGPSDMA